MSTTHTLRVASSIEQSLIRAATGGSGITVLALQMAVSPSEMTQILYDTLQKLVQAHPLLRCKLHYNPTSKDFSFLLPSTTPQPNIKFQDVPSTSKILQTSNNNISPLNLIVERELSSGKDWSDPRSFPTSGVDMFFPSVYALSQTKCVVALRFHSVICDRMTAVSLFREMMGLLMAEGGGAIQGIKNDGEGSIAIEGLVPNGLMKKTLWARGKNMVGYSVSSLSQTNLSFKDTKRPRRSEVVRLQIDREHTERILDGCKSRGIKLCAALAAAGLIAAHSTKVNSDQLTKKKFGVVALIDCRSLFEPPLPSHHFGLYHSSIFNIHTIKGTESLWDLAKKMYEDYSQCKKSNKHFSDMQDFCFLMEKAIQNPSLTPSSSLRTCLLTVFEDPLIENSDQMLQHIGVEDFSVCISGHGVGPSIGFFDIIRNGELDCTCVYPAPLHSREQMNELIDHMKRILIDGSNHV